MISIMNIDELSSADWGHLKKKVRIKMLHRPTHPLEKNTLNNS